MTVALPGVATQVSAGSWHTCALLEDETAWCWGHNDDGNLGDGTTDGPRLPVQVEALPPVREVIAGGRHACAISTDDELWCWGDGTDGALGNRSVASSLTPVRAQVGSPIAEATASLSFNFWPHHSCARTMAGRVLCWGSNDRGQLGNGSVGGYTSSPFPVLGY